MSRFKANQRLWSLVPKKKLKDMGFCGMSLSFLGKDKLYDSWVYVHYAVRVGDNDRKIGGKSLEKGEKLIM